MESKPRKRREFTPNELQLIASHFETTPVKEIVKMVDRHKAVVYRHIAILKGNKRKIVRKKTFEHAQVAMQKMLRVMNLIKILHSERLDIHQLASRIGASARTAYRYMDLLEAVGVITEQDFDNKFYIIEGVCPFCNQQHTTKNDSTDANNI